MDASIIVMKDNVLANAGVMYARPGSPAAQRLLDDVAWRVQLMQNWPETVGEIVRFARPPYYANSDDQTQLNDAIITAVIGNRSYLGSIARYEAKSKYHPSGPEWLAQPEAREFHQLLKRIYGRRRTRTVRRAAETLPSSCMLDLLEVLSENI
ncbi:MAG: hypothetical protein SGPRY_012554 [Prymnesium sp.]